MTHLEIRQSSDRQEIVPASVINKLYSLSFHNDAVQRPLDNTSFLSGNIKTAAQSSEKISFLNSEWQNLTVAADAYTVDFEDPVAEQVCIDCFGSNGMVTEQDLRTIQTLTSLNNGNSVSFTNHPNRNNITKFNEFRFFTNFVGGGTGNTLQNMTNLEEVTFPNSLSNVASMVIACSSLKYIDLHNTQVTTIGNLAQGCTSCEWISLPPSLTSITDYLDSYTSNSIISYVKCYATTPPTISKTKLCNYKTPTIYVPDNSVSLYQADSKWSASGTILPMSNAPQ